MIKEELKQEAEELYKDWYAHKLGAISITDVICKMAEPREKQIAELKKQLDLKEKALAKAKKETKRIADRVNKDKRRLIRRKTELEAQIEKMKSDVIKSFGGEYNVLVAKLLKDWEIKEK